jgi:hypothetical protein
MLGWMQDTRPRAKGGIDSLGAAVQGRVASGLGVKPDIGPPFTEVRV